MKLKLTIALLLCSIQFFVVNAATDRQGSSTSNGKTTTLRQGEKVTGRPNAPSRVYVECTYDDGYMEFSFPAGVQSMTIHLYNDVDEWYGLVTIDCPSTVTPTFEGDYEIECTTDDGRIFSGTVSF